MRLPAGRQGIRSHEDFVGRPSVAAFFRIKKNMTNFVEILIRGLMLGSVYALVGMGLTLVWGVVGIVNIAHGEFVMLGAYFAFWAFSLLHINPLLSVIFSIPVFFFAGVVIHQKV